MLASGSKAQDKRMGSAGNLAEAPSTRDAEDAPGVSDAASILNHKKLMAQKYKVIQSNKKLLQEFMR